MEGRGSIARCIRQVARMKEGVGISCCTRGVVRMDMWVQE